MRLQGWSCFVSTLSLSPWPEFVFQRDKRSCFPLPGSCLSVWIVEKRDDYYIFASVLSYLQSFSALRTSMTSIKSASSPSEDSFLVTLPSLQAMAYSDFLDQNKTVQAFRNCYYSLGANVSNLLVDPKFQIWFDFSGPLPRGICLRAFPIHAGAPLKPVPKSLHSQVQRDIC